MLYATTAKWNSNAYTPKTFNADDPWGNLTGQVEDCYTDPSANKKQIPGTLEGCIMRISDIIAYLGKRQAGCNKDRSHSK